MSNKSNKMDFEVEGSLQSKREKALLIGVCSGKADRQICEEHLDELERLVDTMGLDTLGKEAVVLRKFDAGTYLGSGKVQEMVGLARELGVQRVVFDDEIQPSQQRNLEKHFGITVMDRTEVILDVFAQRAQTREARLQIELAKVRYQFPRLKRLWTHLSRQKGGSTNQKGEGETQMELDKRMLKTRMRSLETELKEVRHNREIQRASRRRSGIPIFALIGYTNAGKSTLLNRMTDAGVLAEDKLFATLDTTTRKFLLPNNQECLLIDTVGFIRKLPHLLVAAFKSTLEESLEADILLHVVDVSHPQCEEQAEASLEVLKEIQTGEEKPIITVLNKLDQCTDLSRIQKMRLRYPKVVAVSGLDGTGFEHLADLMEEELRRRRKEVRLRIPQSEYALVSRILRDGQVFHQDYDEEDVILHAEVPMELEPQLEQYVIKI